MEKARKFFETYAGGSAESFVQIPQSGSSRLNFIAEDKNSKYVVTYNEDLRENDSFLYFSEIFNQLNLNTPKVFAVSDDKKIYIQQFLGSSTLSEIIASKGLTPAVVSLVRKGIDRLFLLQQSTAGKIDFAKTFEYEKYDELPVQHDLYYFKFYFLDQLQISYHKASLLKDFQKVTQNIVKLDLQGLMLRDFQARNIIVDDQDDVHFIDYQSAMQGPLMYDVLSFLYQAKANFPESFREEMIHYYLSKFPKFETEQLQNSIPVLRLIRNLQVLGAYGFRGLIQKKEHFIQSIPQAVHNLSIFSEKWPEMKNYPELRSVIEKFEQKLEIGR